MRLQEKVALVTGAGRGIGRAIADRYADEGAAVGLMARTMQEVKDAADQITATGGRALPLVADVSDQEQVDVTVQAMLETFGRLDIVVNNAAIFTPADFLSTAHDEWQRVVEVNLYGAIYVARSGARAMAGAGRGGRIINISSIHGYRAEPQASHYDVAKGGMDQLSRTLAVELAPYGILVNSIAPGFVNTSMSVVDGVNELETDWFQDIYVRRRKIPLARAAEAHEVAGTALFLASDDSSYITGHVLVVDGGLSVTF